MADTSIRRVTIAEQADLAARRAAETGEVEPNPHQDTADQGEWQRAYERFLVLHSTGEVSA